jgi:hypothetical protein
MQWHTCKYQLCIDIHVEGYDIRQEVSRIPRYIPHRYPAPRRYPHNMVVMGVRLSPPPTCVCLTQSDTCLIATHQMALNCWADAAKLNVAMHADMASSGASSSLLSGLPHICHSRSMFNIVLRNNLCWKGVHSPGSGRKYSHWSGLSRFCGCRFCYRKRRWKELRRSVL